MKELRVLKYFFVNIFVLFLIEKCAVQNILVEVNLFLAIKLQPDLIIRAILQVASILRIKLRLKWNKNFIAPDIWGLVRDFNPEMSSAS